MSVWLSPADGGNSGGGRGATSLASMTKSPARGVVAVDRDASDRDDDTNSQNNSEDESSNDGSNSQRHTRFPPLVIPSSWPSTTAGSVVGTGTGLLTATVRASQTSVSTSVPVPGNQQTLTTSSAVPSSVNQTAKRLFPAMNVASGESQPDDAGDNLSPAEREYLRRVASSRVDEAAMSIRNGVSVDVKNGFGRCDIFVLSIS